MGDICHIQRVALGLGDPGLQRSLNQEKPQADGGKPQHTACFAGESLSQTPVCSWVGGKEMVSTFFWKPN